MKQILSALAIIPLVSSFLHTHNIPDFSNILQQQILQSRTAARQKTEAGLRSHILELESSSTATQRSEGFLAKLNRMFLPNQKREELIQKIRTYSASKQNPISAAALRYNGTSLNVETGENNALYPSEAYGPSTEMSNAIAQLTAQYPNERTLILLESLQRNPNVHELPFIYSVFSVAAIASETNAQKLRTVTKQELAALRQNTKNDLDFIYHYSHRLAPVTLEYDKELRNQAAQLLFSLGEPQNKYPLLKEPKNSIAFWEQKNEITSKIGAGLLILSVAYPALARSVKMPVSAPVMKGSSPVRNIAPSAGISNTPMAKGSFSAPQALYEGNAALKITPQNTPVFNYKINPAPALNIRPAILPVALPADGAVPYKGIPLPEKQTLNREELLQKIRLGQATEEDVLAAQGLGVGERYDLLKDRAILARLATGGQEAVKGIQSSSQRAEATSKTRLQELKKNPNPKAEEVPVERMVHDYYPVEYSTQAADAAQAIKNLLDTNKPLEDVERQDIRKALERTTAYISDYRKLTPIIEDILAKEKRLRKQALQSNEQGRRELEAIKADPMQNKIQQLRSDTKKERVQQFVDRSYAEEITAIRKIEHLLTKKGLAEAEMRRYQPLSEQYTVFSPQEREKIALKKEELSKEIEGFQNEIDHVLFRQKTLAMFKVNPTSEKTRENLAQGAKTIQQEEMEEASKLTKELHHLAQTLPENIRRNGLEWEDFRRSLRRYGDALKMFKDGRMSVQGLYVLHQNATKAIEDLRTSKMTLRPPQPTLEEMNDQEVLSYIHQNFLPISDPFNQVKMKEAEDLYKAMTSAPQAQRSEWIKALEKLMLNKNHFFYKSAPIPETASLRKNARSTPRKEMSEEAWQAEQYMNSTLQRDEDLLDLKTFIDKLSRSTESINAKPYFNPYRDYIDY